MRNANHTGAAHHNFIYHPAGAGSHPLLGDWDGPGATAWKAAGGAALAAGEADDPAQAERQRIVAEAFATWDTTPAPAGDRLHAARRPGLAELDALFSQV